MASATGSDETKSLAAQELVSSRFPKLTAAVSLQDRDLDFLTYAQQLDTSQRYKLSSARRAEIDADVRAITSQRQRKRCVAIAGCLSAPCAWLAAELCGGTLGEVQPMLFKIPQPHLYVEIIAIQGLNYAECILPPQERADLFEMMRTAAHTILVLSTAFSIDQDELMKEYASLRSARKERDQIIAVEAQLPIEHRLIFQTIEQSLSARGLGPLAATGKYQPKPVALQLAAWLDEQLAAEVIIPRLTERRVGP